MKLRADVEVFVAVRPIDLRWSFDRLAGVVSEQIGRNPKAGALFVFFGRRSATARARQGTIGDDECRAGW